MASEQFVSADGARRVSTSETLDPANWAQKLAAAFTSLGRSLSDDGGDVYSVLTAIAVQHVHGAEYAGITRSTIAGFISVAPTAELVRNVDEIQYTLEEGPCVGAVQGNGTSSSDDLRIDGRWPTFGPQAFDATGIVSMMSYRLFVEDDPQTDAALNFYSATPGAFNSTSRSTALLLATHGALVLSRAGARDRANNLTAALQSARDIGTAIGILMALQRVTRDQAFDLLRIASQHTHRKLSDVALEVIDTGAVPAQAR